MLLSPGRDIALDPPPAQRPKICCRAVTCIGRRFVRVAAQIGLDAIEQRSELRLIAAVVAEGVGDDDLLLRVDRGLRVIPWM